MVAEPNLHKAQQMHAERFDPLPSIMLSGKRWELLYGEEGYPESLTFLSDPPKKLYGIGNQDVLRDGLAVIGARKATPYGRAAARQFARMAAERGIPIVSGGALGSNRANQSRMGCGCSSGWGIVTKWCCAS